MVELNREKLIFSCPRSRLRIWSRETGSAVPSRVSLLISILRLNLVLSNLVFPCETSTENEGTLVYSAKIIITILVESADMRTKNTEIHDNRWFSW